MKTNLKQNSENISVRVRSIMPDGIFISVGENDYYLSYDRLPWFKNATVSDIFDVKMCCGQAGIRWEALDVDLEIDSLKYPERYPLTMKRYAGEVL